MFDLGETYYMIVHVSYEQYIHSIFIASCEHRSQRPFRPPRSSHKPLATTRRTPPRAAQRVRIDGAQNLRLAPHCAEKRRSK